MATTKIRGITIELGADTSGLNKALKDVNSQIGQTQKELRDVERLLKLDPGNTELLAQKQRMLADRVTETKDKLKALKDAQADIEQAYKNGDIDQGQYDAFQREIISCENELKQLEKDAAAANVTVQKIGLAGESFKKVGTGIESAGQKIMPVSAAIAGLGVAVAKTSADFDSSMSQVSAVSGAVGEDFDTLRDKAREMGSKTKFSASEAADAMNYMAMAGWKTQDMLGGIEGIMNLAAASGTDLATTSDIVTDALTAFGKSAEDAGTLADILAAASANANTDVEMMGEAFKYVAPVAGSLGYSMEDTSIALGLMANAGIKASNSGTALRSIMNRIVKPTKESATAIANLGLEIDDGQGNMLSFMDIMQQIRSGMGNLKISSEELETGIEDIIASFENGELTEKQYSTAIEDLMNKAYGAEGALVAQNAAALAGKNAMAGLLAIVNASDEDFNKLTEAVNGSAGTAEEMSKIMQDNLNGQLTILMSQLQELAISFGDMMMPLLRQVVEGLQGFVDKLNGMDDSTRQVVLAVGLFVTALGPLLVGVGKLIVLVGDIMTAFPKLVGAIQPLMAAFKALWAVIMANPIAAIIAAIVALVALIASKGDEIQAIIQKVDNFLQNIFAKDWTQVFGPVLGGIINNFMSMFKTQWDATKKILDGIIDFIRGVFTGDWTRAWEGVKKIFGGVFDSLKSLAKAPINYIITMINGLFSGINSIASKVGASISIPTIPMLAKGGVVTGGTAIVGEAGAELLSVSNGAATVQPLTSSGGSAGHSDITGLLETYLPYLAAGNQIVLDTGILVGNTAPAMNVALGMISAREGSR